MTDKYKHTTLFYSKNALSFRSFHKEGFYRENSPVHTSFLQFCRQMKLKMPLECLSDVSRMSFECLQNALCRDLQAAEQSVYDRRSLSCRYQHVRLQGLKRKCFPHAQSAETIRNRERFDRKMGKILYTKICDSSLHPVALRSCIPVTLHLCDLTPYTLRFHFSTSPFLAFRSRQNAKWQEQAGTRCLPAPATFLCFFIFFYYAWRYQS